MAESLRDQLQASLAEVTARNDAGGEAQPAAPAAEPQTSSDPAAPEKPGRTAGRPRDEHGRLLPGKPEKPAQTTVATPEAKPRPKYPSTWKKDYAEHWEKSDPAFAEYLLQREGEYAKGVSAYKQEWNRAEPLLKAIEPFQPLIEQYGINPAQQIQRYFQIHQMLALGDDQAKLQTLAQIARDYNIPVHNLFVKDEQGQIFYNPQLMGQPAAPPQQGLSQEDVRMLVANEMQFHATQGEVSAFSSAKDGSGNPLYPYFNDVKGDMAGLLQAGLANDLPGAYEAALRLHPELQAEQRKAREEAEKREAIAKAQRARGQAVSVRTQTPSAPAEEKPKGRREAIAEQVYARIGGGRV